MNILVRLFFSFFQIGLFSIGGGYAAMPLIKAEVVDSHGWLTAVEFSDLVTIAEMTPGPIAINSATFVGMRVAGIAGVVVATLGNVLPSVIIMVILARLYEKYAKQTLLKRILEGCAPWSSRRSSPRDSACCSLPWGASPPPISLPSSSSSSPS